jgi:hypothetical protein
VSAAFDLGSAELAAQAAGETGVGDTGSYPFAQDLDGVWHRRPEGDEWVTSVEEPNCRTVCGKAIYSVHVSGFEPEADESTGATLCACVAAQQPRAADCGCPETNGKIYHQRGTCTDPVVAKLGWYADSGRIAAAREPHVADGRKLGVALAALRDLSEAADGTDAGTYGALARAALNEIEHLPGQSAPGRERHALAAILRKLDNLDEPGPEADAIRIDALFGLGHDVEPLDEPQPAPELAALDALEKVVSSHERVMYAATIDLIRGDPESALRMLDEQLDGWDGAPWNTAETGAQWLKRTRNKPPTAAQQERAAAREPKPAQTVTMCGCTQVPEMPPCEHQQPVPGLLSVTQERHPGRETHLVTDDERDYELDSADIPSGWREDAEPQPAPEQDPVMHRLSGIIAGWRSYVRSAEEGFPSDREAGHADALREVNRQVEELLPDLTALAERAYAAAPQPYAAEALANALDDFTRTVINVSDRPALTALARRVRKNNGMEEL